MLKKLKYSVTFTSTQKTLTVDLEFAEGFHSITGPNESGKSTILEMIRFSLFGVQALRGKAEDYQELDVALEVTLRGKDYRIERTIKSAKILNGKETVAVGVRAVNQKVVELLGFGLDVFDVACSCNQADTERLGNMKPTERKRMVDSVVGLGVIDDLTKWASEEASGARKEHETLSGVMREPVAPEIPTDYQPSHVVEELLKEKKIEAQRAASLKAIIDEKRKAPEQPVCNVTLPAEALEKMLNEQRKIEAQIEHLENQLAALPKAHDYDAAYLDEQMAQNDAYDLWMERQAFLRKNEKPRYTLEELNEANDLLHQQAKWIRKQQIETQLEKLRTNQVECPECGREFPIEQDLYNRLLGELNSLGAPSSAVTLTMDAKEYARQKAIYVHWYSAEVIVPWTEIYERVPETEKPKLSRTEIDKIRLINAKAEERGPLEAQLAKAKASLPAQDWSKMYKERLAYESDMKTWQKRMVEHREWQATRNKAMLEYQEVVNSPQEADELSARLISFRHYETLLDVYEEQRKEFKEIQQKIDEAIAKETEWKLVRKALTELRVKVKQHLVPSLNKVASHILANMTNGQRKSIVVDEEFEIMVDGQPLGTLSGSAKVVVNLALRLGLGQILTNGVFSVFMGDEIDASMDSARATATADTFKSLKKTIRQILIVSHKEIEADHNITL